MEQECTTILGRREVWGGTQPFGLSTDDRRRHLFVVGKTGSGKTTLLKNLLIQDIEAGNGVGLIDPHGDLAEEILDCIPPSRSRDVVYFNPADYEHPIGFNLLASSDRNSRHLVAAGVVGAFKHIWKDSWGPRLEYLLYAAVFTLLECPSSSLLGLPRLLTDARYRNSMLQFVSDPVVRAFWDTEYAEYDKRFRNEVIAPVQNKVGALLMASPVRNILGQVRSRVSIPFVMDNGRIFIANLSKGKLGEDKASLLGALLVMQFQLAALSRADIPEDERKDFFLSIDEFHNFSTNSFASILSEARKYRLNLTLAHQYLGQLPDEIRDAVFGNVGSLVSFRVGSSDADVLAREFDEAYSPRQFTELENHEVCVKILDGGKCREPFFGKTLPPLGRDYGRRENIIRHSREKFATRRAVVEDRIKRWIGK